MTEFEFDCLQKKALARSAWRRVSGRGRVSLPSDGLNVRELADQNGPCRVYRIGRPMDLLQFQRLPADLQRTYLRRLRRRGASDEAVARMLGVPVDDVQRLQKRFGLRFDQSDPAAWEAFLRG